MKSFLTIVFFALATTFSFAQKELDNKTIHGTFEIQPEKNNPEDKTQLIIPKKDPLPPIAPKDENPNHVIQPFSMIADDNLMDSGEELQKEWDKRDKKNTDAFQKDQFLGTYNITGTFFSVECRDHENVDGDRVRIYVNGVMVEETLSLVSRFKGINANLVKGKNVIEFVALNEGAYSPNTAQFRVLNDNGEVVTAQQWNLLTGVKASLVVFKE